MSKVILLGSEGNLGRILKEKLRDRGHEVIGVDLQHGHDNLRADINEYRQLERIYLENCPDYTYNLAAEFGRNNGDEYWEQLWKSNNLGLKNVIEVCAMFESHLIHASSSEAYGDSADMGTLHEDILKTHVPTFHNEYALGKWTGEKQIEIAMKRDGLQATILRFFNSYGFERYNDYRSVVCLFMYRLMHDLPITLYKDYHRVFMWVGDWASTTANVIEPAYAERGGEYIFNIGGTEYLSVEELVDKIYKLIPNSKSVITYLSKESANIQNKRPDVSRAIKYLGHNPVTTLDEGLLLTYQWMKKEYGLGDGRLRKVA